MRHVFPGLPVAIYIDLCLLLQGSVLCRFRCQLIDGVWMKLHGLRALALMCYLLGSGNRVLSGGPRVLERRLVSICLRWSRQRLLAVLFVLMGFRPSISNADIKGLFKILPVGENVYIYNQSLCLCAIGGLPLGKK